MPIRVVGTQCLLTDSEGALQQRLGFRIAALIFIEHGKAVKSRANMAGGLAPTSSRRWQGARIKSGLGFGVAA